MLLAAGPGSGKTVLLADWALAQNAPVGWINLTAADAAPRRFWLRLCSALRACTGLDEFASAVTANPRNDVVRSLLDSMPRFAVSPVLVIEDAHLLTHPAVIEGLDLIIRSRPPLRLVLAARSDPVLPMHRYRLAGLMQELRAPELAMTRGEVRALLSAHGVTLPPEDMDALLARDGSRGCGCRRCGWRAPSTRPGLSRNWRPTRGASVNT
jgi:LuxR family maltose regulon positive regulatory protein